VTELVPLGELGEVVSGSTPKTHVAEYWDGDIPWITPADLSENRDTYFRNTLRKITKAGYDSCSTRMLPIGSILYSSRAPIGHCAIAAYPLCTNQGFKSVIPNHRLDSVYGYYALRYMTPAIVALGRGATFAEINKEMFESVRIPVPALSEQKRIAALLDKADRLRRTRRYAQDLSDSFLQSVFLDMFGDPVTNSHGWNQAEIVDMCGVIIDCPHYTPKTFSSHKTAYPFIRTSDIQDGYLDWSTTRYVESEEYIKRISRHRPTKGDVIYSREGERFGFAARVPSGITPCLGQRVMLLQPDPATTTSEFLWALLNSPKVYQQANQIVGGSTSPHVNVGDIKAFKVFLPPLNLQQKYAALVRCHDRLHIQRQEAERQAEHLFQTLLHRAFSDSGEAVVEGYVCDADAPRPSAACGAGDDRHCGVADV